MSRGGDYGVIVGLFMISRSASGQKAADDGVHLFLFLLHVGDQLQLRPAAVKVVLRIGNVVIVIPFEIVGQKAHSVFQRHGPGSERERHELCRRQPAAGRDKALGAW